MSDLWRQRIKRLHILFVDSDPVVQSRMQHVLRDSFDVQCVASVSEARTYLITQLPDMMIAEILLGGQENGLDLCRFVRNAPKLQALPIMLLTSLSTLHDKVAGFEAGADDYVVKPFDVRHLMARIRLLARIKRIERQM